MCHSIMRVSLLAVLFMRLCRKLRDGSRRAHRQAALREAAAADLQVTEPVELRRVPFFKRVTEDHGLIDLEKPEESKILKFINMGEEAPKAGGRALISPVARKAEYEAFASWIKASVGDPQLRDAPKLKTRTRQAQAPRRGPPAWGEGPAAGRI